MSTTIYSAPAAAGKTAWVIDSARRAARHLQRTPFVVVATPLQAQSLQSRMVAAGGALGIRILTFDHLYAAILQQARVIYSELDEPVRTRLLRTVLDELAANGALSFYRNLVGRPGFVSAMQGLIGELKGAGITPDALQAALAESEAPARLVELAAIYGRNQELLDANGWTDRPGVAALALQALQAPAALLPRNWGPFFFDGFDSFTVVQRSVIAALAQMTDDVTILLTGVSAGVAQTTYALFAETTSLLSQQLGVPVSPLPGCDSGGLTGHALRPLADRLFVARAEDSGSVAAPVTLLAAADRAGEVRSALRWLKQRIVLDGMRPSEVVLLSRNVTAYRNLVAQTAAEFGMQVHSVGHLPLAGNPAVAALLDLLRLMLPDGPEAKPGLPRRSVVEAWRSPYFDWTSTGVQPGDAEALDALARRYVVIRGLDQWLEAFALACSQGERDADSDADGAGGEMAAAPCVALDARFRKFVTCISPPRTAISLRDYACWLEDLIGQDSEADGESGGGDAAAGLALAERIGAGDPSLALRDFAALRCLKDVLRGLVVAEQAIAGAYGRTGIQDDVDYIRFFDELTGAIEAATYEPEHDRSGSILFADLVDVRGIPYRAAAVLGLAEGEIPRRRTEDPFLRNNDRRLLRKHGLPLEDSTRSFEREWFYVSLGRAREKLLLCRPRMAENGAPWEPSPYWQEIERLVDAKPTVIAGEYRPSLAEVASWPELVESAQRDARAAAWLRQQRPGTVATLERATTLLLERRARPGQDAPSMYDGHLGDDGELRAALAGQLQHWSPSQFERYLACPYSYYLAYVLGLEQRAEPEEGANFAQTGNVYHRILEQVYRSAADPADLQQLLAALPGVARSVLDAAPKKEGFRVTAWWEQTRAEIEANVRLSLAALAEFDGTPVACEQRFAGSQQLTLLVDDLPVTVSGVIDRVDRRPDGSLRVIDYKTSISDYDNSKSLLDGHRLQLAIYALAVQDAMRLGTVSDGFYWFAQKARSSKWSLAGFEDPGSGARGPGAAIEVMLQYVANAVTRSRRGEFAPSPPDQGCPSYCSASAFCWHYRPRYNG